MTTEFILGTGILPAVKQFVTVTKIHPILVNFGSVSARVNRQRHRRSRWKNESLRNTAWWTLFYATIITP